MMGILNTGLIKKSLAMFMLIQFAMISPVWADELDDAKMAGLVGEQRDGYLGAVTASAPASVRQLITRINTERQNLYRGIAQRNGLSEKDVAGLAAQKAYEKTASSHFVQSASGKWVRK